MDEVIFFIDEINIFNIISDLPKYKLALKNILDLVDIIEKTGLCNIYRFSGIYACQHHGKDVADLFFGAEMEGENRDMLIRLQAMLGRSSDFEMLTPGAVSADAALVLHGQGAILSSRTLSNLPWWNPDSMFLLQNKDDLPSAFRHYFAFNRGDDIDLDVWATHMYPDIYFFAPPSQIKNVGIPYIEVLSLYMKHLAYLNDFAFKDFSKENKPHVLIGMADAKGVTMSPESSGTHRDKAAMKQREIFISSKKICCEWHTKLSGQIGRIHFYARRAKEKEIYSVVGDKVIVGIIADHLK